VWQLPQFNEPVVMCALFLPLACAPLWHEAQLVAVVKVLWSGFAPAQLVVLWHASHESEVCT
jgi:hypothetical protein